MSTEVGSKHYRRGVVLGLSLAELFTVLVFLLLLVLGSYSFSLNEELGKKDELVAAQRDVLTTLVSVEPASIQPAYPEDLIRIDSADAMRQLGAENRRLRDRLAIKKEIQETSATTTKSQSIERLDSIYDQEQSATVPRDEYDRQQVAIDSLSSHVAELHKRIDDILDPEQQDQLRRLQRDLENLRERNQELLDSVDSPPTLKEAIEEAQAMRKTIAALENEKRTLMLERDTIADQKGQDSPCWFRMATRPNGESYERAVYLFHVRIDDKSIFVKDIEAPTSQYAVQKSRLRFDRESLDRYLTNEEFIQAFTPLKEDAENRKVRLDRRCTFYVMVWDATSETNKTRYKEAHDWVVEAIFITYPVQYDPWPH